MLILTRRIGETLSIGDDITLTVLSVNNSQVRVGIKCPKDIPVLREEVLRKLLANGEVTLTEGSIVKEFIDNTPERPRQNNDATRTHPGAGRKTYLGGEPPIRQPRPRRAPSDYYDRLSSRPRRPLVDVDGNY